MLEHWVSDQLSKYPPVIELTMFLNGFKKRLIIALLLLTIASQSMAVVIMSCQPENLAPAADSCIMDTLMDGMNQNASLDKSTKQNCDKPMSHCTVSCCSATVEAALVTIFAMVNSDSVHFDTRAQPSRFISSLYRPPIVL